jgi:lysyl-tRNA synthetase, class II
MTVDQYEAQRRQNRDGVRALGLAPYGERHNVWGGLVTLQQAFDRYDEAADKASKDDLAVGKPDPRPEVTVAGRVVLARDGGKLIWMNLRDHTRDLQIAVSAKDVDETSFKLAKLTDLGDVLIARGRLMKTRTGEVTVWAKELQPGTKSLVTPPAKHEGLQDMELRYRRRYVDMWANPETLQVFKQRSAMMVRLREILTQRGYLEVETPMLQTLAGGAAARPFKTHMNALDISLFLRIAPELYLKRLLVGGLPRVFEVNRNFRNEGLDKQHNPEFTMLEVYHAFGDCETVMELTETLVRELARAVAGVKEGPFTLPFGDLTIDYASPFRRVSYAELFEKALGFPLTDTKRVREECRKRHILPADEIDKLDDVFIINEVFEEVAEKSLDHSKPTFITHYPAALSPLTRPNAKDPMVADRADLFIAGMEIAPHYTELNDPDVQEAKFREQLKGLDDEESTFRTFDQDFIDALKVGMPPAGGMGLGIDRLVMLLTNQRTIRDVVLFPLMRPADTESGGAGESSAAESSKPTKPV